MNEEWLWNKEQPTSDYKELNQEDALNKENPNQEIQTEEIQTDENRKEEIQTEEIQADENRKEEIHNEDSFQDNLLKEENDFTKTNDTEVELTQDKREDGRQSYYGGSYHSDWINHQRPRTEDQKTETSTYKEYQLDSERSDKPKKAGSGMFGRILKTVVCAAVFGIVAGFVMFGVNKLANHFWGEEDEPIKQVSNVQLQQGGTSKEENNTGSETFGNGYTVSYVAESCMPSLVSITNASVTTVKNYFGGTQEYESKSSGSGIIVGQNETELLIATNNHVIDGAETITIAFCDESVYEAHKKGSASNADLAVVAVRLSDMTKETLEAIRIIQIAKAEDIQIGDQVVAIGNALGYGQSVTSGWVSAVDRSVEDENGNVTDSLIQTDAAINPGNSGGALLNMRGELIGINSAKIKSTTVEGMGYAISIGKAEPILNELMNLKTRYKVDADKASYIGVSCQNVEAIITQMYGIPAGAFIGEVEENGPAYNAGMKKSDVIVKFDGQTIASATELVELLEYYEAGEVIEIVVSRASDGGYKEIPLTITLGKKKQSQ